MLTTDQKNKVIDRRAAGVSLEKISVETGISKPTLLKLDREFAAQILARKYMLFDEMNEKYALSIEKRIELFGETLQKINQELEKRDFSEISTDKLLALRSNTLQQIKSLALPAYLSTPPRDVDTLFADGDNSTELTNITDLEMKRKAREMTGRKPAEPKGKKAARK